MPIKLYIKAFVVLFMALLLIMLAMLWLASGTHYYHLTFLNSYLLEITERNTIPSEKYRPGHYSSEYIIDQNYNLINKEYTDIILKDETKLNFKPCQKIPSDEHFGKCNIFHTDNNYDDKCNSLLIVLSETFYKEMNCYSFLYSTHIYDKNEIIESATNILANPCKFAINPETISGLNKNSHQLFVHDVESTWLHFRCGTENPRRGGTLYLTDVSHWPSSEQNITIRVDIESQ